MASQRCRTAAAARVSRGTGAAARHARLRRLAGALGRRRFGRSGVDGRRSFVFIRRRGVCVRPRFVIVRAARHAVRARSRRFADRERFGVERGCAGRARVRAGELFARRNLTSREPRRSVAHDLRDREGARWTIAGRATRGLRESMSRRSRLPRSIGSLSMHRPRPIGHRISGGWQKRARCRAPALPFV
ncbi:hypothetical protein ACRUKS_09800 [Burkholderia pseudomallei]|uniref:Uncharacterized protein n=4 Tax=Burkholderia pseudomallei TaxID=28450 RepID=A3NUU0_BURP0|nr:hypothetical protein [Burkholderia pseudomallei]ABN90209.1 conserved hypothetical protein [Burkholderia pseudomallei 1106a]AFR15769.1 hypothetical protein BPC006_I1899 [Burkholderia pseudomallei BPC006]AJX61431.1 hypothetical protein DP47_2401 [Burkholderia pseudomallei Pasteur 52237]AJX81779.1 hypothetical protein BG97_3472 [Burkholderia pseudomallei 7894]EES25867.1 conserved hypothetical protein [Burkholderia pseudomallei 1106b]MCE2032388.1 hypothetical protein [Burkholderia pseudomallei